MRNLLILSATPPGTPRAHAQAALAHAAAFDVCQVGVLLRLVLFVEAVLAVVALFFTEGPGSWFFAVAMLTGGALPATLLWLVAVCVFKKPLARRSRGGQYAAGALLGMLCGLYGCGLLNLTGVLANPPWLGSALAGLLFALVAIAALVLRARGQTPAATAARLAELQSRIRPHFLFNTLNSAVALVRKEPAKAEALLEDLSELFRQALAEPGESVTLADEIALAGRYLAIEQVRFGARLNVQWELAPGADGARLPPLLLQPLIENAVKHGIEPSPQGGTLRIRTRRQGTSVRIEVINSLPPLAWADAPLPRGHGIALANVRDRLHLLHDVQARFQAGMMSDGYRVRIEIPLLR